MHQLLYNNRNFFISSCSVYLEFHILATCDTNPNLYLEYSPKSCVYIATNIPKQHSINIFLTLILV